MKKRIVLVILTVLFVVTACMFTGCDNKKISLGFMSGADGNVEYVKVAVKNYDGKMLSELLAKEESIGAKMVDSGYGPYLTEIKGLKPEGNQYISVFTNLEEFKDESEYASAPIEKDDVTYFMANVGIGSLPVREDAKYLFVLLSF